MGKISKEKYAIFTLVIFSLIYILNMRIDAFISGKELGAAGQYNAPLGYLTTTSIDLILSGFLVAAWVNFSKKQYKTMLGALLLPIKIVAFYAIVYFGFILVCYPDYSSFRF